MQWMALRMISVNFGGAMPSRCGTALNTSHGRF
jgi:hypothetical protein